MNKMALDSEVKNKFGDIFSSNLLIALAIICFSKALLIPAYRSTDFEVHRNWLAVTHSLPVNHWYYENTSQWTLDYPPFFAYFERLLSFFALFVDPEMLQIKNLSYSSYETIVFQRLTVIVTDVLFLIACTVLSFKTSQAVKYEKLISSNNSETDRKWGVFLLMSLNCGLIMVDHIHFQYNGVLLGLLLLSLYFSYCGLDLAVTALFSILILMKHLFVPLTPVFGAFILRQCWEKSNGQFSLMLSNLTKHGIIAVSALSAAFLPFIHSGGMSQMQQIFQRLFPFQRGLVHAYWAPNIWALYCLADKLLTILYQKLLKKQVVFNVSNDGSQSFSSTSGMVGEFAFGVLPKVGAGTCLLLIFVTIIPALFIICQRKDKVIALFRGVVYASMCSFMVGYHVHEKAIIIPWLIQTFVSFYSEEDKVLFFLYSAAGSVTLFPLIPGSFEWCIKLTITMSYCALVWRLFDVPTMSAWARRVIVCVMILLSLLVLYTDIVHRLVFGESFPFLPLLLISSVCAVLMSACWVLSFYLLLKKVN